MKFIPRNITKFNILTLKTWGWCLSEGRWFSIVVFPPSRYPPCGWDRNRCRCSRSAVVSRSQQDPQSLCCWLGVVRAVAQNRWLRSIKILSRAWHWQRFAVRQSLGDIGRSPGRASSWAVFQWKLSSGQRFALVAIQLETEMIGPTCWPYLYQNTPLVSGGLVPPPLMRKCAATKLPPTVAMQFSPLTCGKKS